MFLKSIIGELWLLIYIELQRHYLRRWLLWETSPVNFDSAILLCRSLLHREDCEVITLKFGPFIKQIYCIIWRTVPVVLATFMICLVCLDSF